MAIHAQNLAILKGLVAMVWADGKFADEERQAIEGFLTVFGASEDDVKQLFEYASTPRTLDDVPWNDLSQDDRRSLLAHAVLLSWVDGSQAEEEKAMLEKLIVKLGLDPDEAKAIWAASEVRIKKHLSLL